MAHAITTASLLQGIVDRLGAGGAVAQIDSDIQLADELVHAYLLAFGFNETNGNQPHSLGAHTRRYMHADSGSVYTFTVAGSGHEMQIRGVRGDGNDTEATCKVPNIARQPFEPIRSDSASTSLRRAFVSDDAIANFLYTFETSICESLFRGIERRGVDPEDDIDKMARTERRQHEMNDANYPFRHGRPEL